MRQVTSVMSGFDGTSFNTVSSYLVLAISSSRVPSCLEVTRMHEPTGPQPLSSLFPVYPGSSTTHQKHTLQKIGGPGCFSLGLSTYSNDQFFVIKHFY